MAGDRRSLAALLLAACGGALVPGGPGVPGGPVPPPRGRPTGLSVTGPIGPGGGSVTLVASDGGQLQLSVPPGALGMSEDFTITEIAVTGLAGAAGSGFRLAVPMAAPAAPVTLAFTPAAGVDPSTLTAASLGDTGYWSRVYAVSRDGTAVYVTTEFFGDWSLVTLATQLDLHGPFRLDSTEAGLPFTAQGEVTLQYLAEGLYLPQGDITLTALPCDAPPPAAALPASIAELKADTYFRWGINGQWQLSCGFVSTNFDSLGITNLGCARSYSAVMPVQLDAAHVSGQYVIDCGTDGRVVASWDLVPPDQAPGILPAP